MDEPCEVHFVGILKSRDLSDPTAAQVYNYTGLNGLAPDFNGTINVTQAGIPFSSGMRCSVCLCMQLHLQCLQPPLLRLPTQASGSGSTLGFFLGPMAQPSLRP